MEEYLQMMNAASTTNECIKRQVDTFGAVDWEDRISYYENGTIEKAPLSFACFAQCWYEVDDQVDQSTKLPSAKAILASLPTHKNRGKWVKQLSKAMKKCEDLSKLPTPTVTKDKDEINPLSTSEVNEERCINSLRIDSCVSRHLKQPTTDKEVYPAIAKTHDFVVAVRQYQKIDREETEREQKSKLQDPDTSYNPWKGEPEVKRHHYEFKEDKGLTSNDQVPPKKE